MSWLVNTVLLLRNYQWGDGNEVHSVGDVVNGYCNGNVMAVVLC